MIRNRRCLIEACGAGVPGFKSPRARQVVFRQWTYLCSFACPYIWGYSSVFTVVAVLEMYLNFWIEEWCVPWRLLGGRGLVWFRTQPNWWKPSKPAIPGSNPGGRTIWILKLLADNNRALKCGVHQLVARRFSTFRLSNGMPTVVIIAVAKIIMTARLI